MLTAIRLCGLVSAGLLLAACITVEERGDAPVVTVEEPAVAESSETAVLASREQFDTYSMVFVEPVAVTIAAAAGSAVDGEAGKIADYFRKALFNALSNRYKPAKAPGAGVLSVRATISGADAAKPPEPDSPSNGDATDPEAELPAAPSTEGPLAGTVLRAEVTDSVSNERLAVMSEPAPQEATLSGASWSDVESVLDDWALRFATTLAAARPAG